MKNKYIILYYLSVIFLIPVIGIEIAKSSLFSLAFDGSPDISVPSSIIWLILLICLLVICITIMVIKKKLLVGKILFPIMMIIFTILAFICAMLFNDRVMVPYVQFGYYVRFILLGHLLLDIYTLLGIKYK